MNKLIINGVDVAHGTVVTALEAMLDGADDAKLRDLGMYRWSKDYYYVESELMDYRFIAQRALSGVVVYVSYVGCVDSDNIEEMKRKYHPLCLLSPKDTEHDFNPEWNDVCRDMLNGLIRMRLLQADAYNSPKDDE